MNRDRFEQPPPPAYAASRVRPKVDYLRQEAANASLGAAGELFVLEFERARLLAVGKDRLAGKVEHVSETREMAMATTFIRTMRTAVTD